MQITCLEIYYALLSSAKYFFRFSMKVVFIYVTHYMEHILGYGVFTKKQIQKGELILNCHGELIDEVTAVRREKQYEVEGKGSFLFFFMQNNKRMW